MIAIIVLSYLWTPASVSLTGYSGELTRDVVMDELTVVVNVHLRNAVMEPQSVTVYCTYIIYNNTFGGPVDNQIAVVEVNPGQTLDTNITYRTAIPLTRVSPEDPPKLAELRCSLHEIPEGFGFDDRWGS